MTVEFQILFVGTIFGIIIGIPLTIIYLALTDNGEDDE